MGSFYVFATVSCTEHKLIIDTHFWHSGMLLRCDSRFSHPLSARTHLVKISFGESGRRHLISLNRPLLSRANKDFSANPSDQLQSDYLNVERTSAESPSLEVIPPRSDDGIDSLGSSDVNKLESLQSGPKMFHNRFLNFVRISSVLNNTMESFFKSEIRRRLFVTAVLIIVSRVGYFIPLPGFDRRLIPQDYLSFVSGSVGE